MAELVEARERVYEAASAEVSDGRDIGSRAEACVEIAAAAKRGIRESGLSREQVVDLVNEYFGDRKLSIHMLNHHLSKPSQYPLPAHLIFALQDVTGSLEIIRALAAAAGAQVVSREEVRLMNLGKLEQMITEMQRLKREIKR